VRTDRFEPWDAEPADHGTLSGVLRDRSWATKDEPDRAGQQEENSGMVEKLGRRAGRSQVLPSQSRPKDDSTRQARVYPEFLRTIRRQKLDCVR